MRNSSGWFLGGELFDDLLCSRSAAPLHKNEITRDRDPGEELCGCTGGVDRRTLFQATFPSGLRDQAPSFSDGDQTIDADGVMKTSNIGFRYIIHIGYNF